MNIKQMQQMMKQAQTMQNQMGEIKSSIDNKEFSTTVGGGVVSVTALGNKTIQKIEIKEELLDPSEKTMLQDLIALAINNLFTEIDKVTEEQMGPLASGLQL